MTFFGRQSQLVDPTSFTFFDTEKHGRARADAGEGMAQVVKPHAFELVTCKPLATSGSLSHPEVLERRLGCIPGASKASLACGRA